MSENTRHQLQGCAEQAGDTGNEPRGGQGNSGGNEMSKYVAVVIDCENNADLWWENMRKCAPTFTASLSRNGVAVIRKELCDILIGAPGYNEKDSPDYAPFPVIFYEEGHKDWESLTREKHLVFDELS